MRKIIQKGVILLICLGSSGRMPAQNSATPPEMRFKSWESHQKLKETSPYNDLKWRSVGPEFSGGRIEALACHPNEPFTLYAGVGSGNLWKSVNNGTTWKPIFEHESTFTIGCVTIAPSDRNILWVGTGEVLMARSSYAGTGVFKSTDAGETWQNMGLHDSHHIPAIVVDPGNPDVVYVAVLGHNYCYNEERGVFKTTDGGRTWEKIFYISEKAGIVELQMDPSDNKTLYAAAWERDRKAWNDIRCGEGSGVYKTTDAGKTWQRLTVGLPTGALVGRTGLAIAASQPEIIYALVDNHEAPKPGTNQQGRGELYRSDDKGETWRKMHDEKVPTSIGWDYCLLRVSPDNPDELFILGFNLLHSTDAGKTYTEVGQTVVHLLPHDIRVMHVDHHDLLIDPNNPDRLILANDGGLYISYDRGGTWLHHNNFSITEVYAVWVDMDEPYNIYVGTQDNAASYGPANHNTGDRLTKFGVDDPWKNVYLDRWGGGDSYFTYRDPADHSIMYYEHQFGALRRKNMKTGETKDIMPRASETEIQLRYNWMTPYFISLYNPVTIYYAAHRVFKSTDRGDNWTCISPDLTTNPGPEKQGTVPYGTITMLSESPLKQGVIYAGTDDGNVQVTTDDGKTWELVNSGLPRKWVSRVVASQHEPGTVYVSLTGYREDDFRNYLYMSIDFGKIWNSIAGNLPPEGINVIREDPRSKNILYAGTELGVYVTTDRGVTWHSLCNNLPTTPVHDMVVHPREYELVIGTHGRGCFVLDISSIR